MNLFYFKPALISVFLFWQISPQLALQSKVSPVDFRYRREIVLPPGPRSGEACAVLDAQIFAHSAPSLKDLHLYSGLAEIPYRTTVSEPSQQDSDDARIINRRTKADHIIFDLEMPHRPYTSLTLDLAAQDYIATVAVSGSVLPAARIATSLGVFTLFDLTAKHLFHSTSIALPESTYPFLHLDLSLVPAPEGTSSVASLNLPSIVRSVTVPPSREAQSLYTPIEQKTSLVKAGQESVATLNVQARVPIERIAFALPVSHTYNFSRPVRIEARGIRPGDLDTKHDAELSEGSGFTSEEATGTIVRVRRFEAGRDLSVESLTIPVAIGSNMQQPASIQVHVEDGHEASLPLSVQLQMRQRRVCFNDAATTGPLTLFYGDSSLDAPAPSSEAAKLFQSAAPRIAQLGPEMINPLFAAASLPQKRIGQRPVLRWIALLCCVCIFALLVIRSAKRAAHR